MGILESKGEGRKEGREGGREGGRTEKILKVIMIEISPNDKYQTTDPGNLKKIKEDKY